MIQEIGFDHRLDNHFVPYDPRDKDRVLNIKDARCLVTLDADVHSTTSFDVPRLQDYGSHPKQITYLFSLGDERFFLALDDEVSVSKNFTYATAAQLRLASPSYLRFAVVTAIQLWRWYADNQFCGRCGHPMQRAPKSREIVCPSCAYIVYPKICPAVICGITSGHGADEKIVLTHYAGRTTTKWALVAGFTEIGETFEETVQREIMEEVGLHVKNLRYYKSQPWSFTDTLLTGFWCEVEGDPTICVDHDELKEARWFSRAEIPAEREHDDVSLTGEMIECFRRFGCDN